MRYPSVKLMAEHFEAWRAKGIRSVMEKGWSRSRKMEAIDAILGTHGVEYVPRGRNQKSPAFCYCNAGDPYLVTVMLVDGGWLSWVWRIGCWGDIVERGRYD